MPKLPRHPPPPTRFAGPAAIQPKVAATQVPPPPTRFAPAPGLQAKAAPARHHKPPLTGPRQAVQRMEETGEALRQAMLELGRGEVITGQNAPAKWDSLAKQYVSVIAPRQLTERDRLRAKGDKTALEIVQEIALDIPPVLFQCGLFAKELYTRLASARFDPKDKVAFETKYMRIKPTGSETGHDSAIYYAGADPAYSGLKIGYDNHIYTVVTINGAAYVFDNVNQTGIPLEDFRQATILAVGRSVLGNVAGVPGRVDIKDYDAIGMSIKVAAKKVSAPANRTSLKERMAKYQAEKNGGQQ